MNNDKKKPRKYTTKHKSEIVGIEYLHRSVVSVDLRHVPLFVLVASVVKCANERLGVGYEAGRRHHFFVKMA